MTKATEIVIPDIGISGEVIVIDVSVKVGDLIKAEQTLITLEGEKASMEIPSPSSGKVVEVKVKMGDKVKTGSVILTLSAAEESAAQADKVSKNFDKATASPSSTSTQSTSNNSVDAGSMEAKENLKELPQEIPNETKKIDNKVEETKKLNEDKQNEIYASPLVRRLARELDINLNQLTGTGHKNRLQKSDLLNHIKTAIQSGQGGGNGLPQAPVIDFSQFGEISTQPLSKIKKFTAQNLHRNWLLIPHVTQFDEADITELENFRKAQQSQTEVKLTPLVFLIKAVIATLKKFPAFNGSLAPKGDHLIIKKYFHIGVAVDTPDGLVVPVIRHADQKSLIELAQILAEISTKARAKQLTPADMQGSSFTLSSLGGIGGSHFTPIVNLPNTAILGISKATIKPIYQNDQLVPRLMLPLSLSYDHRVIDGAEGARFMVQLTKYLTDIRLILM